ncbi:tetratricopeptide repeat protein [Treponema sp.]|uniref:tetratricopeptide repeat protein n=1 Tax=Treponema sp. TaxID=166 RepID=UPI0025CDB352|nr:tetratricopeptide repeat protein [Treponema sp.]MCR5218764.1 tetratricopeptide repeat protein [Treponema sp.]
MAEDNFEENALREGIALFNRGNYSSALTFFLSLPDSDDIDSIELSYYLGLCYAKMKRYDDALVYLEQVVTAAHGKKISEVEEGRVFQCRYLLAVIYCLSGRLKLADFELKKLLDTGYNKDKIYSSLAYLSWEKGEMDQAVDFYEKSLKENENNPTALNGLGYMLALEGKELTKALSCCKKALDMEPENAACLDSLGYVYFKMGLFSEAKKFLERAYDKRPDSQIIEDHIREVQAGEE